MIDIIYPYRGYRGTQAKCRLRIYQSPPMPRSDPSSVVIATELPDNPGTCITSLAEQLAIEVSLVFGLEPERMIWIEHYPEWNGFPEHFDRVTFEWTGHRFIRPQRMRITDADLCELLVRNELSGRQ